MENPPERWDVFCRVVDNYGDVGVSWRLARQLAREHGKRVRLWIDDLVVMAKLRPELDAAYDQQALEGVEVCRLREPFAVDDVADVVVETFGCDPPPAYVQAMAERRVRPRWINLEYLSAEDWVEQSHALPSPHPRLPLVKHYFFPGFTPRTAGLLREAGLVERRDAFQSDPGAQAAFWRSIVGKVPPAQALKVSLFTYLGAPVDGLARSCRQYAGPVWLVAPQGAAATALRNWTGRESIRRNEHAGGLRRELEVFEVAFLPQDSYDLLLWSCDVNFVRGEDSFVRAHWAGRPFVWNVYPTDDGAHWVKMSAFLTRFTEALDPDRAGAVSALHEAWNRADPPLSGQKAPPPLGDAWARFLGHRQALRDHSAGWGRRLAARPDLVSELVDFCDNVLK